MAETFQAYHENLPFGSGIDVINEVGGANVLKISTLGAMGELASRTKKGDRIVIHCRKSLISALPFLILNRITGRNRVAYNPHTSLKPTFQNIFLLNSMVDKVICLTEANRKALDAKGLKNSIVIPNPIPMKRLEKYAEKKASAKEYDFVWAGRNVGFKRLALFLRCLKKANGCRALLMTNNLDDGQTKLAQDIGERLSVRIGIGDADFFQELSKSKAYIFTSNDDEGLPVLLLEAASIGLPIIATDTEKFREILQGEGIYWKDEADLVNIMEGVAKGDVMLRSASASLIAYYGSKRIAQMYQEW